MFLQRSVNSSSQNVSFAHPCEREQDAKHRVYLFGQFRLFRESQPLGEPIWRRNKAKSLLKWFILNPGKLYAADQLIDLFWPELPVETGVGNLHVTIHYLRHLLEPQLPPRADSTFVRRNANNFYWFQMDETWWSDVLDVQMLLETAQKLDKQEDLLGAAFHYRKIVNYCQTGFLLEDAYEDWLQPYRHQYNYIYSQALIRLIEIHVKRREWYEVMDYAHQALAVDAYCEPAVKAIISVYLEQGNISSAIRKLDDFQLFLKRELGMAPSKDLLALRERIIRTA
jgi:DNA-binding SARP family transcriptional activator